MFIRRKNPDPVIETQEPSSPKVTCIGQVRVRRSSKHSDSGPRPSKTTPSSKQQRPWWCVPRTLFYTKRLKPRSFRPMWRKCSLFFRFGYCRKSNIRRDSSKVETETDGRDQFKVDETEEEEEEEDDGQEETRYATGRFSYSSPPKNAFILTRCKSAPYRSSSLGSRFWGSPLSTGDVEDEQNNKGLQQEDQQQEPEEKQVEDEPNNSDSASESRDDQETDGNSSISKQLQGSINGRISQESIEGGPVLPLILTRCKSEPARTGERLNPEIQFLETNKVGFCSTLYISPLNCD